MKRGLASSSVHSAFATTRRWRLQLVRVLHLKSLKRRAGLPVRRLCTAACSSSALISAISRSVFASPNRKSTPLVSHQTISSSRAKPESARSRMRTHGHRRRIWATMRATSSTEPAAASMFARPAWQPTDRARRTRRAADSSSNRNSRGRTTLLLAVHRIVRRIEIEDDLVRARSCASRNKSTNSPLMATGL